MDTESDFSFPSGSSSHPTDRSCLCHCMTLFLCDRQSEHPYADDWHAGPSSPTCRSSDLKTHRQIHCLAAFRGLVDWLLRFDQRESWPMKDASARSNDLCGMSIVQHQVRTNENKMATFLTAVLKMTYDNPNAHRPLCALCRTFQIPIGQCKNPESGMTPRPAAYTKCSDSASACRKRVQYLAQKTYKCHIVDEGHLEVSIGFQTPSNKHNVGHQKARHFEKDKDAPPQVEEWMLGV